MKKEIIKRSACTVAAAFIAVAAMSFPSALKAPESASAADSVLRYEFEDGKTEGGKIHIRALGSFTMMYYTGENYETESKTWGKEEVILPPGKVRIQILVQNRDSFPAIYVDGVVESDETWLASDATPDLRPVGCTDLLCDPEHTPDVFPFEYDSRVLPIVIRVKIIADDSKYRFINNS